MEFLAGCYVASWTEGFFVIDEAIILWNGAGLLVYEL